MAGHPRVIACKGCVYVNGHFANMCNLFSAPQEVARYGVADISLPPACPGGSRYATQWPAAADQAKKPTGRIALAAALPNPRAGT